MKTTMLKPAALFAAMTAVVSLPAVAVETACVAAGGINCPAQIPDFPQAALVSTMTVPALTCTNGGTPTGVAVRLNITHNWTGDLTVSVANPNANSATLLTASPLTNDVEDVVATYTGYANLLGASAGVWTLTVTDTANGNDGALHDWGVDVVCSVPAAHPHLVALAPGRPGPAVGRPGRLRPASPIQVPIQPAATAQPVPTAYTPNSNYLDLVPFDTGLPRTGQWRDQFAFADVDRDGHPDIVLSPARKSMRPPVVFRGDGKGAWTRWKELRFPPLPYDYGGIAAGDFSADGRTDIVLGMHLRGLAAVRAEADGVFADATAGLPLKRAADPLMFSSRRVFLLDWQGTGKLDLVALGEGMAALHGGLMAYAYGQDGWQPLARDAIAAGARLATQVHGKQCLVAAVQSSATGWALHEHCGGAWRALANPDLPARAAPIAIAAADLDRDGVADVALAYRLRAQGRWLGAIDLLYSGGGKPHRRTVAVGELKQAANGLAFGRPRGGDTLNLAALGQDGSLTVYAIDGATISRDAVVATPEWRGGCRGYGLDLADLDADGRDEIVASFAGEPSAFALATEQCRNGGAVSVWRASKPAVESQP